MEPIQEVPADGRSNPAPPASPSTARASERRVGSLPLSPPAPRATNSDAATAAVRRASSKSKRSRGAEDVTANACTECRKKRAKCDGRQPCTRCKSHGIVQCKYEARVRQSKDSLRDEIEQLRHQRDDSDSVLAAVARPDLWEEVSTNLRNGWSISRIAEWLNYALPSGESALPDPDHSVGPSIGLDAGAVPDTSVGLRPGVVGAVSSDHHQSIRQVAHQNNPWGRPSSLTMPTSSDYLGRDVMDWSLETIWGGQQPLAGSRPESRSWSDHQKPGKVDQDLAPEIPEINVPARRWTDITSDIRLVQHLLSLYFCWEYPIFTSLSKDHFIKDFQAGRSRFCSSILVNALLALGCRFSRQPASRSNRDDPYTSGDHFFEESQRLFLQEEDHHNVTTIQALGIMSIREASCGRDAEARRYAGQSIRLAIDMGFHENDDTGDDNDVSMATFWGAFALDHMWALATGFLPQTPSLPTLPPKPNVTDEQDMSLWIPYTDNGQPLHSTFTQPSHVRSVYKYFCELSELISQSLRNLYLPGKRLSSRDLLKVYTRYISWYDEIPEDLRLGYNFTPGVIVAHMYYHFAILLLFRPLIKFRVVGSSIYPQDLCLQAADTIQDLLRSYSQLYSLSRTPSFVPHFALASSMIYLAIGASSSSALPPTSGTTEPGPDGQKPVLGKIDSPLAEALSRGIAGLVEMASCHHFAAQALKILQYLAKERNIEIAIGGGEKEGGAAHERTDETPGLRPVLSTLKTFVPNVEERDFICA